MTNENETPDHSFAIVTPTYLPDLARCELLIESIDRTSPSVAHYLIVDRRDRKAFRHLEGGRRRIIDSEALLGSWIIRAPGRRGVWVSLKSFPVRGWIIQQILKIGAIDAISERTLVFCDSDTAFFRRLDRSNLLVSGKIGLLDLDYRNESNERWAQTARSLLGLPGSDQVRNFVGNMICWNRETVIKMRQQIEKHCETDWRVALARTQSFSEYVVYGTFVREFAGYNQTDHAPSAAHLVKASWGASLDTLSELSQFFSELDPETVAIMIHSKQGVEAAEYRPFLERLWREND